MRRYYRAIGGTVQHTRARAFYRRAERSGSTLDTIPIAAEYHRPARIPAGVHRLFHVSSRPRVIYGLGPAAGTRSTAVRRRTRAHAHARRRAAVNGGTTAEPRGPAVHLPDLATRRRSRREGPVLRAFAPVVAKSLSPTDRGSIRMAGTYARLCTRREGERRESDGTARALITT